MANLNLSLHGLTMSTFEYLSDGSVRMKILLKDGWYTKEFKDVHEYNEFLGLSKSIKHSTNSSP